MHGTKWSLVACMVPCRTSTQCRERWVNVLDTRLNRGKWSEEEDEKLFGVCKKYEGKRVVKDTTQLDLYTTLSGQLLYSHKDDLL